jgi:hypothetical protein
VQAETRTLTHLFQLDVRYVIPLYQRPYVWSEERQWAPLWEDIVTVADHVMVEGASAKSPAHFLGAIVIQQQENPPGSPQRVPRNRRTAAPDNPAATTGRGRPYRRGKGLSRRRKVAAAAHRERSASEEQLRHLWRVINERGRDRELVNMYGSFFSICLRYAGLAGFGNGLTYSEFRDWPALTATGAAPRAITCAISTHSFLRQ